jgi:hypothetical protein
VDAGRKAGLAASARLEAECGAGFEV